MGAARALRRPVWVGGEGLERGWEAGLEGLEGELEASEERSMTSWFERLEGKWYMLAVLMMGGGVAGVGVAGVGEERS